MELLWANFSEVVLKEPICFATFCKEGVEKAYSRIYYRTNIVLRVLDQSVEKAKAVLELERDFA